jgi:hypothetical protein
VRRRKAARPTAAAREPHGSSQAGELRTQTLDEDQYAFQGLAVYAGDPFHCVGHLLSRGRDGFEAFDADTRSLGTFPDMKAAADAVTAKAVRP